MSKAKGTPRKFSEKIALLNKKESEATAEFEKIIKEVEETTTRAAPLFYSIKGSCSSSCINSIGHSIKRRVSLKGKTSSPKKNSTLHTHPHLSLVPTPDDYSYTIHHTPNHHSNVQCSELQQFGQGTKFVTPSEPSSAPLRLPNIEISPILDDRIEQNEPRSSQESYFQQQVITSTPTSYLTDVFVSSTNTLGTAHSLPDISNINYRTNKIATGAHSNVKRRPQPTLVIDHAHKHINHYVNEDFSTPYNSTSQPETYSSYEHLNTSGSNSSSVGLPPPSMNVDYTSGYSETSYQESPKHQNYASLEQPASLDYNHLRLQDASSRSSSSSMLIKNTTLSGQEDVFYVPPIKHANGAQMSRSTGNVYGYLNDCVAPVNSYADVNGTANTPQALNVKVRSNSYSNIGDYDVSYNCNNKAQHLFGAGVVDTNVASTIPDSTATMSQCQCYECNNYNSYYPQPPQSPQV